MYFEYKKPMNALIFDNSFLYKGLRVTINNVLISNISTTTDSNVANVNVIDATGLTLLLDFINTYIYLDINLKNSINLFRVLTRNGIITSLDIRNIVTSNRNFYSRFKQIAKESLVNSPELVQRFVENRVAEGIDYIKIVVNILGPSQEIVNILVSKARKRGKLNTAHATRNETFVMVQKAKVDIIIYIPLDFTLDESAVKLIKDKGRVCVLTLVMAEKLSSSGFIPGMNYKTTKDSVVLLYGIGVLILAGTDSNRSQMAAGNHGESFHHELELLKNAGLSYEKALRAGTSLPAKWFLLQDRGVIEVGKRADLILVEGNSLDDISATKKIRKVWIAGKELPSAE
ncbi:hypothetical protein F5884DRAFT_883726 [Xylogone sp. PMI_703]|nr:hypothetical protein F5884DRAFT_883726 [Xylogone sp. PMI_703]